MGNNWIGILLPIWSEVMVYSCKIIKFLPAFFKEMWYENQSSICCLPNSIPKSFSSLELAWKFIITDHNMWHLPECSTTWFSWHHLCKILKSIFRSFFIFYICDVLRDLVLFAQFKNVKNTHEGVLLLVKSPNRATHHMYFPDF